MKSPDIPPRTLYIDTEVFRHQKGDLLRAGSIRKMVEGFREGELRLLIPEIMKRELLDYYKRECQKLRSKSVRNSRKLYGSRLDGYKLKEYGEWEKKRFERFEQQWETFKKHFVVEDLPLVVNIEKVVDWYFSGEAPFKKINPAEEKSKKGFPDAFIISVLDKYYQEHKKNIAVISGDSDFKRACHVSSRSYLKYYKNLEKYIKESNESKPSSGGPPSEPADAIRFTLTKDLSELKAILERGDQPTDKEIKCASEILRKGGERYRYFFAHAGPVWIDHLRKEGFFGNLPDTKVTSDE